MLQGATSKELFQRRVAPLQEMGEERLGCFRTGPCIMEISDQECENLCGVTNGTVPQSSLGSDVSWTEIHPPTLGFEPVHLGVNRGKPRKAATLTLRLIGTAGA